MIELGIRRWSRQYDMQLDEKMENKETKNPQAPDVYDTVAKRYEELSKHPSFLCVRARNTAGDAGVA